MRARAFAQVDVFSATPYLGNPVAVVLDGDWRSGEARQRFEQLMERLREQLMQQVVDQMSEGMQGMSPQDMQHMKDMIAGLNEMLERRQRGEEPGFERGQLFAASLKLDKTGHCGCRQGRLHVSRQGRNLRQGGFAAGLELHDEPIRPIFVIKIAIRQIAIFRSAYNLSNYFLVRQPLV